MKMWCLWGQKLQYLSRSERQRTFDLETALICGWRTATLDQDYHVYHYNSQPRSHKHNFLFVYLFIYFTAKVHFRNWFCFLYFAGFPRKLTGKISFHVFFIFHKRKISACGWVIHTAVVGTHGFPEEGNGPGLLLCFTVRTSVSEPNIQLLPPTMRTYAQNEGQRGPFSEDGLLQTFTVSITVAFHCWGRYRQRQQCILSWG